MTQLGDFTSLITQTYVGFFQMKFKKLVAQSLLKHTWMIAHLKKCYLTIWDKKQAAHKLTMSAT